jgi:hypothetical protein
MCAASEYIEIAKLIQAFYFARLSIPLPAQAPATAKPVRPTPATQTPQPNTSFCHLSLLRASAYPTSGLKVTISYRLVQPLTVFVGNGLVRDTADAEADGRGKIFVNIVSRWRRR